MTKSYSSSKREISNSLITVLTRHVKKEEETRKCVFLCKKERERESVCVFERERECVCVCVCVFERERENFEIKG